MGLEPIHRVAVKPEVLYHYTDLNAFISIIRNKKLWLTGANNLNDHKEVHWGLERIRETLQKLVPEYGHEQVSTFYQLVEHGISVPYFCSLSEDGDILSQWRAYSADGTGISIGIKATLLPPYEVALLNANANESTKTVPVHYVEAAQDRIIHNILHGVFALQNGETKDDLLTRQGVTAAIVSALAITFKNPAFHEEREWRIIHKPMIYGDANGKLNIHGISQLCFRAARNRIISYFEYDFTDKVKDDFVAEIVLGPKCEASYDDIRLLLASSGFGKVEIRRSSASYR